MRAAGVGRPGRAVTHDILQEVGREAVKTFPVTVKFVAPAAEALAAARGNWGHVNHGRGSLGLRDHASSPHINTCAAGWASSRPLPIYSWKEQGFLRVTATPLPDYTTRHVVEKIEDKKIKEVGKLARNVL